MRHLFILFVIVFVYLMPEKVLKVYGSIWFAYHAMWSYGLVKLISADKSKYIDLIIVLEIIATIINIPASIQQALSLNTASILNQYSHIMTAIFIAEVAIIMGVLMRDMGVHTIFIPRNITYRDDSKHLFSGINLREKIA